MHKSRAFSSAAARQINGQELSLLQKKKKMTSFSHYPLLSLQTLKPWHEWQFFLLNVFAPPVFENHIPATVGGV